jgi:hypothetical protein
MRMFGGIKWLAAVTLAVMVAVAGAAAQGKPKVAVYVTDGGDKSMPAKALAMAGAHTVVGAALVKAINLTGKGEAVNFTKEITKGFGASVGEAQAADIGRQFNVQNLCVVTISGIRGKSFSLGVKMIDVASGRVTATGGPALVDLGNPAGILTAMTNITVGLVSGMVVNAAAKAVVGPQASPVQSTTPVGQQVSQVQTGAAPPVQAVMAAPPPLPLQDRPCIAVYVNGDMNDDNVLVAFRREMLFALVKSGRYRAIEGNGRFVAAVNNQIAEQGEGVNGLSDQQIAVTGDSANVDFVCVVDIASVLGSYQALSRVIDVKSAEVVEMGKANGTIATLDDITEITGKIIESMFKTGAGQPVQPPVTTPPPVTPPPPVDGEHVTLLADSEHITPPVDGEVGVNMSDGEMNNKSDNNDYTGKKKKGGVGGVGIFVLLVGVAAMVFLGISQGK